MDSNNTDDEIKGTDEVRGGNAGIEKAARIEAMRAEKEELDLPGRAKFKRESPIWKGLMRSKGESPAIHGLVLPNQKLKLTFVARLHLASYQESSSRRMVTSGCMYIASAFFSADSRRIAVQVMFTLTGGSNWMCTTSEDEWPFADQPEAREEIRKDFEGTWGDREFWI